MQTDEFGRADNCVVVVLGYVMGAYTLRIVVDWQCLCNTETSNDHVTFINSFFEEM